MKKQSILNTASLKEQVYDYLREEIRKRKIEPGTAINMDATSRKLGISKTPLRDALIQLEMEGFVTIEPRKGIYVNGLALPEIREYYQVIGALESAALTACFNRLKPNYLNKMKKYVQDMHASLEKNNFASFHKKNLDFHNVYIDLSGNHWLKQIVTNLKKRLYDFFPQDRWIKEWELSSMKEHERIVEAIEQDDLPAACFTIKDVHWSYEVQEKFINAYYSNSK